MRGKAIVLGVGAATLALAWAGPAGADPVNAKKAEPPLTIHCDNGIGTVQIVSPPGNGRWTPGLVTTSNVVGIPYEFHVAGTFTPPGGTPQTFTDDSVKPAPHSGRLATCTWHEEGTDPDGTTFSVDGTAKISYSGAH